MKLSLQDRVALIYTSAGSQRKVAALLGVSHQKVGRILRIGQEGGYAPNSRMLSDPGLIDAVNMGFEIHKDVTRQQARQDALPYTPSLPVFASRMDRVDQETGEVFPGDRVEAKHVHWLSDSTRNEWLKRVQKTERYYSMSVGSLVNLVDYNRLANAVNNGKFDNIGKLNNAKQILQQVVIGALDKGEVIPQSTLPTKQDERKDLIRKSKIIKAAGVGFVQGLIHTRYSSMTSDEVPFEYKLAELNSNLNEKHAGATGDPGTAFATRILLQVDTRYGKDDKFRKAHPIPKRKRAAPNRRKAR